MATLSNITVSGITTDVLEKRLDHLWSLEDKGLSDSEESDKTIDGRTRSVEIDPKTGNPIDATAWNNYKVLFKNLPLQKKRKILQLELVETCVFHCLAQY